MPNETIKLKDINRDPRLQLRVKGLDKHHVAELADALKTGKKLGAIKACRKGKKVFPFDGWHRIAAHEEAGRDEIEATIQDGDLDHAALLAAGSNSTHGLKRTNDDKRASVQSVLTHPAGKEWSDARIADHVGVSHPFVASMRSQLVTVTGCDDETQQNTVPVTRVGRDGKKRTVPKKKPKTPVDPLGETTVIELDTSTNGTVEETPDPLDDARKKLRSLAFRLDAKFNELKELASEVSKLSGDGLKKLHGSGSITSRIDDAARSCKSAAANLRNAVPETPAECTSCKGRGYACKDCGGDGWQSTEERRDANNRRNANAPKVVPA
jgi:hypothetical protein